MSDGYDGCGLRDDNNEADGAMVRVGKVGKAEAETEGAAVGDDIATLKTIGVVSNHQPTSVLHSTSPVQYRVMEIVKLEHRCQQHEMRGHTMICVIGSAPTA